MRYQAALRPDSWERKHNKFRHEREDSRRQELVSDLPNRVFEWIGGQPRDMGEKSGYQTHVAGGIAAIKSDVRSAASSAAYGARAGMKAEDTKKEETPEKTEAGSGNANSSGDNRNEP